MHGTIEVSGRSEERRKKEKQEKDKEFRTGKVCRVGVTGQGMSHREQVLVQAVGRAKEYHLARRQKHDLVKKVEDVRARLVDGAHDLHNTSGHPKKKRGAKKIRRVRVSARKRDRQTDR